MQTLPRNLGKRHFFDQLTLVCNRISTLRFKKAFVGVSSVECVRQAIEFYNGSVFKGVVIGIQVPKNMPWLRKMVQDLPKNAARSQQVTPQPNPEGGKPVTVQQILKLKAPSQRFACQQEQLPGCGWVKGPGTSM